MPTAKGTTCADPYTGRLIASCLGQEGVGLASRPCGKPGYHGKGCSANSQGDTCADPYTGGLIATCFRQEGVGWGVGESAAWVWAPLAVQPPPLPLNSLILFRASKGNAPHVAVTPSVTSRLYEPTRRHCALDGPDC